MYNERSLHHGAFPGRIIPQYFFWFTNELQSIRRERLRPNDGRMTLAVPIFFPYQVTLVVLVGHGGRINRAIQLGYQRPVILVRPRWLIGHGDRYGQRSSLFAPDV